MTQPTHQCQALCIADLTPVRMGMVPSGGNYENTFFSQTAHPQMGFKLSQAGGKNKTLINCPGPTVRVEI